MTALLTLWRAEELRGWLLEAEGARWPARAAGVLVAVADQVGIGALHARAEELRAGLYGVRSALPPPPVPLAPVETVSASQRSEVAPRPKRVLLVGASSIQFAIGQALEAQLSAYEDLSVRRVGKVSTGLSRPDAFNWPARLEELLAEEKPDLVIVNFGGNDAQSIPLPNNQAVEFGGPAWDELYGQRVFDFVARIRARGAQAAMIGMPVMRSPDFSKRMFRLNQVTKLAVQRAGGIYLSQWDLAANADGGYRERVVEGGKSRPMRLQDGIHFSEAGGRYVVARLLRRLAVHVRLVPKDKAVGVMEQHTFSSAALGRRASYLAWLPRVTSGERVPLLVLLHGADSSPDDLAEHLQPELARAAQQWRVAVVAPDGGAAGWWLDSPEHASSRYASLVAADLLPELRANLPLNGAAGILGISMGGHGALTLALTHPEMFRSASSISGAVDLTLAADRSALIELLGPYEAQRERWEASSAFHLIARAPERARGLALRISCGAGDRWISANRSLHERVEALHIAHAYDEAAGGHDWSYWQEILPQHLAWHAQVLAAPK